MFILGFLLWRGIRNFGGDQVKVFCIVFQDHNSGADPGGGGGGGALGAEAPPFIFRLYLINMLRITMKFCLSIII